MKTKYLFTVALFLMFFGMIISIDGYSQIPPWLPLNGLVAWYPFNGNANDESGNNRNGTIYGGATLTTDRFGNPNCAYDFDGSSGYIRNDAFPTNLNAYTYFGWYKSDITNYTDCCVFNQTGYNASGEASSFGISCANIYINARHRLSNMNLVGIGLSPLDLNWNFLATTWDGQWVRVYKNGTQIDSANLTSRSSLGSKFFIGCGFNLGSLISYFFNGKLDDIGIYDRALTQGEITGIYQNNSAPTITTQPANAIVCKGSNTTFSVVATGAPPLSYKWFKNGDSLSNGNQSSYVINNIQPSDEGYYYCTITNSYGSIQSTAAILTVIVIPSPAIWGATSVPTWSVQTYSVTQTVGSTYLFSVINGNKISNTENSITVQWGSTGWGQIVCTETDNMGCISDPSILNVAIGTVGIDETSDNGFIITPNPTTGKFSIASPYQIQNIVIYASSGEIIQENDINIQPILIDLTRRGKGLFFIKIQSGIGITIKKVVVY
jgi:hypothetical protein